MKVNATGSVSRDIRVVNSAPVLMAVLMLFWAPAGQAADDFSSTWRD